MATDPNRKAAKPKGAKTALVYVETKWVKDTLRDLLRLPKTQMG